MRSSLLVTFLACTLAHAQDYRAKVQGIVTDSSQGVVAGATVTLLNINTGIRSARQTNEVGQYLFDYVEPGSYSVSVEFAGFSRFVQESILVQSRGDVTVNAVLKPGAVQDTITVLEAPVAVQFNTTTMGITIDRKMANDLPRFDRNPFKFALLDPAVVNTNYGEMMPYHSWAANYLDVGGSTNGKNDLLVDGSPVGVGYKASYTPALDSVQEVTIQQNSVDAEFGHSAGGVVSMSMKSGTNEYHGTAFYLGRNPSLNALNDRTTRSLNLARYNMWGGTLGSPILKNKLFNFFSYEQWKQKTPSTYIRTLPSALERAGDFSQSRNIDGGIRAIYDPWTTVTNPGTNTASRTPFPLNRIPSSRFDPLSASIMGMLWEPNNAGDNITGINNFKSGTASTTNYHNISERADWNINDKWRAFGRFSRFRTNITQTGVDATHNKSAAFVPNGSARHALSISGDAVYTLNASTVLNVHGDYHSFVDDYAAPEHELGEQGLGKIWGNNSWYKPYETGLPAFFPRINVGSSQFGQQQWFWYQHPDGNTINAKLSQQRGRHYLKGGFETRHSRGISLVQETTYFPFNAGLTADTYINPNTRLVGHEYATFLLGAVDNNSFATAAPLKQSRTGFWGAFLQDDFKLSPRVTLNLGVRWEYEAPFSDPAHEMSRYLDLANPIPEFQANPPRMPDAVRQYMTTPYAWTGAWIFTDADNPGIWKANKTIFMPRLGLAYRVTDKMALRLGYARYVIPAVVSSNFLEPPYPGFDGRQTALPLLEGVPQARLSDPYPASSNPLIPPKGKNFGRYLGVGGGNLAWFLQDFVQGVNDRFNLSIQQQLPAQIVLDVTLFANVGHDWPYNKNINQMDPRLSYTYKTALNAQVANPFYQYLNEAVFPGTLRNQRNIAISTLLKPYPHYGSLTVNNTPGIKNLYKALQIKLQRPFAGGYNFLFGYNYNQERTTAYFDNIATYLDEFTWQPMANPRHRISAGAIYELPFGKGRRYLSGAPRIVDYVLGGWQTSGILYYNSGDFLRLGTAVVSGNPAIDDPAPDRWFDTTKVKRQPDFTPRSNPWQHSGFVGPRYWVLDGTISKDFAITEKLKSELKAAGYNVTNRLNRANPDLGVDSSTFGRALRQRNSLGRQVEFGLKLIF